MPQQAQQAQNVNSDSDKNHAPSPKIEGFDPSQFAKNLAIEAGEVIPKEFSDQDKKFIVEIVHKFCFLCGDALAKDTNIRLNAQQASIITQFIGEWTFHKSVDLIKGGISIELREGVLQKVAFTVFEIAKQAMTRNLPQEQVISVIELQVKKCFTQAIEELKAKGRIDDSLANNTLNQSNIDDMSKAEFEQEQAQALSEELSDSKILKLASLALLIKKLPKDKAEQIISKFNQSEAQVLSQYSKMPNLEQKIDKGITMRCLNEIKEALPEPKNITMERVFSKLFKIIKNGNKNQISNIIDTERPLIKEFVMAPYTKEPVKIPARVGNVICKYLEEKLQNDNKK